MNNLPLKFHHLGLVVQEPTVAKRFLEQLGYQNGPTVYDPHQNVNLIMSIHPRQPDVEIIFPAQTPGPLDNLIQKHKELIYHIGYEVDNAKQTLSMLKEQKFQYVCVSQPKTSVLFNKKKVSFYSIIGFGLIELIENDY